MPEYGEKPNISFDAWYKKLCFGFKCAVDRIDVCSKALEQEIEESSLNAINALQLVVIVQISSAHSSNEKREKLSVMWCCNDTAPNALENDFIDNFTEYFVLLLKLINAIPVYKTRQ